MPDGRAFLASLEQIGIKLGLDQIRALVERLGHPEQAFPSILVAGTNGKGSVTAMVERGLRASGLRTGRYTSPHLVRLEERVAINGQDVDAGTLDKAIAHVMDASRALPAPPSFFEATTAAAFEVFKDAAVEVAVLEVGLGGRLDATNVVDARAAAITAIDLDHQEFLGDTVEAIAREKAGVIKPGALVVLGRNSPGAERAITDVSAGAGATLIRTSDSVVRAVTMVEGQAVISLATPHRQYHALRLGLRGRHQIDNALTAVRLLEELPIQARARVPEAAIRTAVEDVVWPARLELIRTRGGAAVLIDGAHNPAGARALADYIVETYGRPLPMVVGIMKDKHAEGILAALSRAASHFVMTAASSTRAATPRALADLAREVTPAVRTTIAHDPLSAVEEAFTYGTPVVVAGSLYLAGEIRAGLS